MSDQQEFDIGMIGLGVMGRNLALNFADHGYSVAGFDKSEDARGRMASEGSGREIDTARDIGALAGMLRRPRAVLMLVPAGDAVDSVIKDLREHLEPGDIIIDAGNSYFRDTDRRANLAARTDLKYLGVGVSGGEAGARHGPSIMPGGPRDAYERVREMFEAASATSHGEPCVTWLGPGSAGHFVKMVHNGIEYGLMQLIAETYDLMHRALGLDNDRLHEIYAQWNATKLLEGYLMEITADIFAQDDDKGTGRLVDAILDEASQKGTGMWTSETTLELHVPAPTIDLAVAMRDMSAHKNDRKAEARILRGPAGRYSGDVDKAVDHIGSSLLAATVMTYAQGMAVLGVASEQYGYGLDLEAVARIWRGGCIIRSSLLEDIRAAFRRRADLPDLLMDEQLATMVEDRQTDLRATVAMAAELGIPAPCLAASLSYFDALRSERLPANLIQAQRDYFGSHTYKRIDREGTFHTEWRHPETVS